MEHMTGEGTEVSVVSWGRVSKPCLLGLFPLSSEMSMISQVTGGCLSQEDFTSCVSGKEYSGGRKGQLRSSPVPSV